MAPKTEWYEFTVYQAVRWWNERRKNGTMTGRARRCRQICIYESTVKKEFSKANEIEFSFINKNAGTSESCCDRWWDATRYENYFVKVKHGGVESKSNTRVIHEAFSKAITNITAWTRTTWMKVDTAVAKWKEKIAVTSGKRRTVKESQGRAAPLGNLIGDDGQKKRQRRYIIYNYNSPPYVARNRLLQLFPQVFLPEREKIRYIHKM